MSSGISPTLIPLAPEYTPGSLHLILLCLERSEFVE